MVDQPYGVARFRRALLHFVGGRAAQAAARAILILVLVRVLPLADYGAYMLLVGLSEMLLQVASFGILPVGHRYLPQMITSLSAKKLFRFVSALGALQMVILCVVTVVLWQLWPVITPLMGFSAEQTAEARPAIWLFLLTPAFRFSADLQECLLEQGKAQLARALMPVGRVVGIGLLMLIGVAVDLPTVLVIDVLVTGFCLIFSWLLLLRSLESLRSPGADGEIPVREMLRLAWHMAAVDLMGSTASPGAIRLALANALGVVESGLFAFLQSLERLVSRYLPGVLLRNIIRPVLVARAATPRGMAVLQAGSRLLFRSNLIIVTAGSVVIAVAGDALVDLMSGGKFPNAGFTLLLMFLVLSITAQRSVIEMVMQITGHTATLRATAFIAPVALAGVWLFADRGLNVAILIVACGSILSNGIAMATLSRSTGGFKIDWRGLAAAVVPAVLVVGAGILLRTVVHPIVAAATAMLSFALLLWLTKPFGVPELGIIERGVGRRVAKIVRLFTHRPA